VVLGASIGGFVFLLLIGCIVFVAMKKCHRRRSKEIHPEENGAPIVAIVATTSRSSMTESHDMIATSTPRSSKTVFVSEAATEKKTTDSGGGSEMDNNDLKNLASNFADVQEKLLVLRNQSTPLDLPPIKIKKRRSSARLFSNSNSTNKSKAGPNDSQILHISDDGNRVGIDTDDEDDGDVDDDDGVFITRVSQANIQRGTPSPEHLQLINQVVERPPTTLPPLRRSSITSMEQYRGSSRV